MKPSTLRMVVLASALCIGLIVGLFDMWARHRTTEVAVARPQDTETAREMRIVSLAPSVTEILFALGVQESLVGVTDRCDFSPEAKEIPRAGRFGRPNAEVLLALRPTLVISSGLDPTVPVDFFRKSGMELLDLKTGTVQEVLEAILDVGRAVGRAEQAKQLVDSIGAELDSVARQYAGILSGDRPRVFVELWHDPVTTAGKGSFIDDLIRLAGGVNVASELDKPYAEVSAEKVVQWDPDVVVLAYMTKESRASSDLAARIGWSGISAVKNCRIIDDIPPDLLVRPGPRIVEGVKALAERIH